MSEPSQNVGAFVQDAYQLIDPGSPTVPLRGNDMSKGIQFLNELLSYYGATGNLITVAKQVDFTVGIGQAYITFGDATYTPTPDVTTEGRLANIQNAWLTLEGVTYPLIDQDRNEFQDSYYFNPLAGLPRFIIVYPETNLTKVRIFPAPSQVYDLSIYGKWQVSTLRQTDDMSNLPLYCIRWLRFALANDLCLYKGRASAWTPKLEDELKKAALEMEATTSVNLTININRESWLNGANRVRAGI